MGRWTGLPVEKITLEDKSRYLDLARKPKTQIIGQDEAVNLVADAIVRSFAGFRRAEAPIGSFLFLGSTGVGKTELAKALARELFLDPKNLLRFDMSEYSEAHSESRLIGAPPGYVGHDAGGQLTEAVRRRPYAVILFDEVEKAHPRIFNTLLQVLDDGRLTDGHGKTVDFTNVIIILTSNLRADDQNYKLFFKPEFLNRLDACVSFQPLHKPQLQIIVNQQFQKLVSNFPQIKFILHESAQTEILNQSYSPEYGARPIRRFLEQHIITQLSKQMLSDTLPNAGTIQISYANSKFQIQPQT